MLGSMGERRWLVIASDGRHVTVGRATDPTPESLDLAASALRVQGLGGWLAVSEGSYYEPSPLRLMMVRLLAEAPGVTWRDAAIAFMETREVARKP